MDTSEAAVQVRDKEPKRHYRTIEEKRSIVEETLHPGAFVARVARAHGVNANQVFGWRRLYQQGQLESRPDRATTLLPVRVIDAAAEKSRIRATDRDPSGVIHIEVPRGHLRITERVDVEALGRVLEKLLA